MLNGGKYTGVVQLIFNSFRQWPVSQLVDHLWQGFSINFVQGPNCFDENTEGPNAQSRFPLGEDSRGLSVYSKKRPGGHVMLAEPQMGWCCVTQYKFTTITDIQKCFTQKLDLFYNKLVQISCTQNVPKISIVKKKKKMSNWSKLLKWGKNRRLDFPKIRGHFTGHF